MKGEIMESINLSLNEPLEKFGFNSNLLLQNHLKNTKTKTKAFNKPSIGSTKKLKFFNKNGTLFQNQ